ncbi:hypothetical protein BGW42_000486 [Actinomortierella wolfii]|nr:hypothetical protein BGW42_000486 [Actinomortierella wolfii]
MTAASSTTAPASPTRGANKRARSVRKSSSAESMQIDSGAGAESTSFHPPGLKKAKSAVSEINPHPSIRAVPGRVFVFGTGDCAQLGLGEDITSRKKPTPLAALDDEQIVDIAAGGMHNMALTAEGKLWSWGVNDQKTLGRSGDEYTPAPVEGLDDVKIVKVACSDSVTVALSDKGEVYTWGTYRSAEGILGHSKDAEVQEKPTIVPGLDKVFIVDIATGTDHVLALSSTGLVYSWGNGQQGQLGRRIIPRRMLNGLSPEKVDGIKDKVRVGAGSYHSFAIDQDGKSYGWGLNNYGQAGQESPKVDVVPSIEPIAGLKDLDMKDIQGGEHHSVALTKDGKVYTWGRSDSHQLGLGYVSEPPKEDGTAAVPEEDASLSTGHKKAIRHPTLVPGLNNIDAISVGSNHTLALTRTGEVYAWGFGEMLACGNGEEDDVPTPLKLTGQKIEGHRVIAIAAGGQHSMILAVKEV